MTRKQSSKKLLKRKPTPRPPPSTPVRRLITSSASLPRELRRYQEPELMLAQAPFAKLVKLLLQEFEPMKIQKQALLHLMRAGQLYLVSLFSDAHFATMAEGKSTTLLKHLQLAVRMS